MASIERTAYPRLHSRLNEEERNTRYKLRGGEQDFVRDNARGSEQRLTLALMLKTFRHLGYFPELSEIPDQLRGFVCQQMEFPPDTPLLDGAQRKATLSRYRQSIRERLGSTVYGEGGAKRLRCVIETAAQTMSDPADLINVAVEDLVKVNIELPAFSTLDRLVAKVRTQVHKALYAQVTSALTPAQEAVLESLLVVPARKVDHTLHAAQADTRSSDPETNRTLDRSSHRDGCHPGSQAVSRGCAAYQDPPICC